MTTDLVFMPTLPQNPPSAMRPDKFGPVGPGPSSKKALPDSAKGDEHETFLKTLRKVFRDRNRSEGSQRQTSTTAHRKDKVGRPPGDERPCYSDPVGDDIPSDTASLFDEAEAPLTEESQLAAILNQLMALLEKLGLKIPSGENSASAGTSWEQDYLSNPSENTLENLSALKQLLATIHANGLRLGHEIAPGLESLRQLIAQFLGTDAFGQDDSGLKSGINPAQQNAATVNGAVSAEGGGVEKAMEILSVLSESSSGADNAPKATETVKSVENANTPLSPQSTETADGIKPNPTMRAGTESDAAARDIKTGLTVSDSVPGNADDVDLAGKAGDSKNNGDLSQLPSTADKKHRLDGEPIVENTLTGQSSPVSKLINDAQVEKENPLKADLLGADDAGGKVVKLEAGTSDSGQLASQGQTFEKTLETTSLTKEAEASSRELHSETMKQIVRRAVIQVRNGQHEARIDLKPDFMGQVRMQVSTSNHQVTVKILTEFGFVKDMIENNIQQLKAELQQQGLEVDQVDVSISRDADGNRHPQENTGHVGSRQRAADSSDRVNEREGQPESTNRSFLRTEGPATVDYFA